MLDARERGSGGQGDHVAVEVGDLVVDAAAGLDEELAAGRFRVAALRF